MANPLSYPSMVAAVAELQGQVRELLRRKPRIGATNLDELDDAEVKYGHADAPGNGYVLTWDTSRSTPFGGLATFAPPVAGDMAVTEAIAVYDNSEDATFSFDEVGGDSWYSPAFVVAANSYQLVLVTVDVSVSDTLLGYVNSTGAVGGVGFSVGFPTAWIAEVKDITNDPSGLAMSKGNGSGSCGCTIPIWLRNETDEEATLAVDVTVRGTFTSFVSGGYDGTVLVRAESVFSIAAVTP